MKREEKRKLKRERDKLSKTINKLNNNQILLVDKLAEERAVDLFKKMEKYIFKVTKETMRENRIGKERADKIIKEIKNKIING